MFQLVLQNILCFINLNLIFVLEKNCFLRLATIEGRPLATNSFFDALFVVSDVLYTQFKIYEEVIKSRLFS